MVTSITNPERKTVSPCRPGGRGSGGGGRGRGKGRGGEGGSSRGRPKTDSGDRPRPRPEENSRPRPKTELPRMPMQKKHMTSENQASVKELLRELQTQDFEEPDEGSVADMVLIRNVANWHYSREVGVSLGYLLQQCLKEKYGKRSRSIDTCRDITIEDCLVQRQEEAFALSSIYGDRFTERIHNRLWTVTLELEFLIDKRNNHKQGSAKKETSQVSLKDVCQFYLKGAGCRFGVKCRFKHQMPIESYANTKKPVGPSQSSFDSNTSPVYELVIRFPEGNRYPFQAPVVAFTTTDETLPLPGRLHISEYLYGVALVAAVGDLLPASVSVKKAVESEEEEDDLEDPPAVPVENESYVNFKKKFTKKYEWKAESVQQENTKLCRQFRNKQERQKLPAWQEEKNILEMLSGSQVLVVSGMTGCGKTTQIPQFILDDTLKGPAGKVANIICTQPRRISAISVAERVAQERAERLGTTVGYQIRLESVKSSATRLLYCTAGVLLRRLQGDTDLRGVTHVIVDEVHERTEESDFLLLVLKDIMIQRPDLRIILTSATLNAELFSQYFYSCPTINMPGCTFPVDAFFLEDAIAKTRYVTEDGSPYMRSGKQGNQPSKGKSNRNAVEQFEDDMWSFMHFQKDDFVKDSIPDQQLTLQQMTVRAPQGKYQLTSKGAVKMQPKADELRFMMKNDGSVHVHPSSVNYPVRHFDSPYLVYHEKVKTSRVFIRDCSMVSVYPLVLFGGGQVKVDLQRGEFVISLDDGWICFAAASHQVAELVKELRWELDQLLEDKIKNPTMDLCSCPRGSRIIDMIVKLVTTQ
ncbi:UNVERIFIED_CONTAM: hypothetical protein FKN15_070042 [Acipenser sinensis]